MYNDLQANHTGCVGHISLKVIFQSGKRVQKENQPPKEQHRSLHVDMSPTSHSHVSTERGFSQQNTTIDRLPPTGTYHTDGRLS